MFEFSDLVHRRRTIILASFVLTVLAAGSVAVFAPDIMALNAQQGALIGAIGLMVGVVAAVVADATDTKIYGTRHVRGTGGELAAIISAAPSHRDIAAVLDVLDRIRQDRIDADTVFRVGIADASPSTRHAQSWTAALAEASAHRGERVLEVALAGDATNSLGVCDVVRDNVPLSTAAQRVSATTQHARLNPGPNRVQALEMLSELTATLPRNLDTYLVGLPLAASRPVISAVGRLDVVLVVAEYAHTTRVELIAGLDAIEAVGVMTQVLLVADTAISPPVQSSPPVDVPVSEPVSDAKVTLPEPPQSVVAATSLPTPNVSVPERDADATQRMNLTQPILNRTHDNEDRALLQAAVDVERYAHRAENADDDHSRQR